MTQDLNERVELRTERLLLRPFELEDVDDVLAYASEPDVGQYLSLPRPYTRDHAVEFVARQVLLEWSTRSAFAIVFEGHVVGGIGLSINRRHDSAELGYALGKPQWGRGLTPEAARAVVGWGFERYALNKVGAYAAPCQPPVVARHGEAGHDPRGCAAKAMPSCGTNMWTMCTMGCSARSGTAVPVCRGRARVECPC